MSALVVDSSSWVSYLAGRGSALIDVALDEGRVHLPPIVAAELTSGRMTTSQRRALAAMLSDLPLCACDLEHWLRVGELRARLRALGVAVSTPDAHVAQCALDLDAELLTEDGIFAHLAQHSRLRLV